MKAKGFTLIELLLAVGASGIILLALVALLGTLLQSRVRQEVIALVDQESIHALNSITSAIRDATATLSPAQGQSASSVTLARRDAEKNPTVISLSNGVLQVREGGQNPYALTSWRVRGDSLAFANLSPSTSTRGTISVSLTLSVVNSSGRNEYSFTRRYDTSASLRQ